MPKQDFLQNFRVARNFFFHPRGENGSQTDPGALERMASRAALWLTPRSVREFNANDFAELGPDKQRDLAAAVKEFLEIANRVPATETATPEELNRARVAFSKLLTLLSSYIPVHPDGEKLDEALKHVEFPNWPVNWDYKLTVNDDGEAEVIVYLYADENSAPLGELGRVASQMATKIREEL